MIRLTDNAENKLFQIISNNVGVHLVESMFKKYPEKLIKEEIMKL